MYIACPKRNCAFFVASYERKGGDRTHYSMNKEKEWAGDDCPRKLDRQPTSPQRNTLMVSISLPAMRSCGNPDLPLPGVLTHSLWQKGDVRTPVFFGGRVAARAAHMPPRGCPAPVSPRPVQRDVHAHYRFLKFSPYHKILTLRGASSRAPPFSLFSMSGFAVVSFVFKSLH